MFANHLRLTLSGEIRPADLTLIERFSLRLNMSDPGGPDGGRYNQPSFDDVVADSLAFWANPLAVIGKAAKLTEVKWARIGPAGTYTADPFIAAVSVLGGGSNPPLYFPPQVSIAVSLGTARRGPRGRGRVYLPCPAASLGADGRINANERDGIQTAVVSYLEALNNWPGTDLNDPRVVVASSFGFNSDVTNVRVGRAFDTVRSRREDILEAYAPPTAVG